MAVSVVGPDSSRRFWWVNQNQTHKEEIAGGFMWSPKRSQRARNQFYDNMREVKAGDVVFSFYGTRIQCIGIAVGPAETAPKPAFGPAGQAQNWSDEGWLVPVEYTRLTTPYRPKDHIEVIRPHLPSKYSPLQDSGDGLQGVYLAGVSPVLGKLLVDLAGDPIPEVPIAVDPDPAAQVRAEEEAELANLQGRKDIGETKRLQLVRARRGQGIFRINVRLNEPRCRVTGVADPAHLRASHIKPWKDSSDEEKVHGCNGLLLAPHVDHLFDRGWTSFTDDGDWLVSATLDLHLLDAWGLPRNLNVGPFSELQAGFLEFHRSYVFR